MPGQLTPSQPRCRCRQLTRAGDGPSALLSRPPLPASALYNLSPLYLLFVLLLLQHPGLWASRGLAAWKGGWGCQGAPGVTSLFREALAPKACQGFVLGGCVGEKKVSKAPTTAGCFLICLSLSSRAAGPARGEEARRGGPAGSKAIRGRRSEVSTTWPAAPGRAGA